MIAELVYGMEHHEDMTSFPRVHSYPWHMMMGGYHIHC